MPTAEQYKHYSTCQELINDCKICSYVWGTYSEGEKYKYRKIMRHGRQTLALYNCSILDHYKIN